MPRKDTKLKKLAESVHMTVEDIRTSGIDRLDYIFLEYYTQQAAGESAAFHEGYTWDRLFWGFGRK